MIPESWKESKLKDLVISSISNGVFNDPKKVGRGYKLINVVDLYKGSRINLDTLSLLELTKTELEKFKVNKGDIFVTRSSLKREGIAHTNIFDSDEENIVYDCHIMRVIPNKDIIDPKFLYYYTHSSRARKYFMSVAKTGTMTTIAQNEVGSLPVLIPPLNEQRKISQILSEWDDSIHKLQTLIESKKLRKKAIMQQLLTGKKRFSGLNNKLTLIKLKDCSNIRRGASPRPIKDPKWFSDTGRGWIRISDVTSESSRYLKETTQYLSELGASKSVPVNPGDLIMSICATIGVPKILGIEACIHDGFVLFRDFENHFDKYFLFHFLSHITEKLSKSGQPGTQKNLNTEIVGNIEVLNFSLKEQAKIVEVLNLAEEEILYEEKRLEFLNREKKGLMQLLLTGKKRVEVD